MAQHKIRHGAVITECGLMSQEFLVQPRFLMLLDDGLSVAGERAGKAGDRIKQCLGRLHNAERDIITDRLHLGQAVGIGVGHIGAPGHAAHLRVLERLHQIHHRIGIQKAV